MRTLCDARAGGAPEFIGVALHLQVLSDGVTVRLVAPAGEILDHLYCPMRAAPYILAPFGRPAAGTTLRIGHITPRSEVLVSEALTFSWPQGALSPERVFPDVALTDFAAWPQNPFAAPGVEDAPARLRDRLYRALERPTAAPWLQGLKIWLESGDEQSHCLMKYGLYEPESLLAMERRLSPGALAVDIGANCGLFTLVAARAVAANGRILALEPSPREFARLSANVALNGFDHVRCLCVAAAETPGIAMLNIAEPPFSGHNTFAPRFAFSAVALAEAREVPAATLDELLKGESRCDFIKLDVEGAEFAALRGAEATIARHRPTLLVEINPAALSANGASAGELLEWLAAHGYELNGVDPRNAELTPFALEGDRTVNALAAPRA